MLANPAYLTLIVMGGGPFTPCDAKLWKKSPCAHNYLTTNFSVWYCFSHDKYLKFQLKIKKY